MPVFVPRTPAPTHLGAFRHPVTPLTLSPVAALPVPFLVTVEAAFNANLAASPSTWTWTNISADLRRAEGVTFHRGRPDESGQVTPTQITFSLNNFNGQYTPRNAAGANYPYIRQNLPFRLRINSGDGPVDRGIVYADTFAADWDRSLRVPTVAVSASGILRRLGQGRSALRPPLQRAILAASPANLLQYWPLEEGSSATGAASALATGVSMIAGGTVRFAGFDPLNPTNASFRLFPNTHFGFGPLPDFISGGSLTASFASNPSGNGWTIQFTVFNDILNNTGAFTGLSWTTSDGSGWSWVLDATGAGSHLIRNGTTIATLAEALISSDVRLDAVVSGGNTNVTIKHRVGGTTASGSYAGTPGNPNSFKVSDGAAKTGQYALGELRLWDNQGAAANVRDFASSVDNNSPWNAYQGETATARLVRLCAEDGVPLQVVGVASSATMGPQPTDAFLNLIREPEAADGGILSESITSGGLRYLARNARYNLPSSFTVDMALRQLAPGWAPTEDDQRRRNYWTVGRTAGAATVVATDATGPQGTAAVGVYDDTVTLNLNDDSQLPDQAAWRVHLGTVEQMRYPTVPLNLRASPELITAWRTADLGARFTQTNLPSQHQQGPMDLIYEGSTEFCDGQQWTVAITAGPYDPWNIDVLDSTFVLDLGGITLQSAVSSLATGTTDTWVVVVAAGYSLLTTTATRPGDFPLQLNCEGEQVTATAIVGASSPQTLTVTRAVNGVVKIHPAGASLTLWKPPVLGL